MPFILGSKRCFYIHCLSPQAYCLNALFYPTKSIFRPTSGHWIFTFYSSLESFEQKKTDFNFIFWKSCKYISILKFAVVRAFSKMYNLSYFAHFLLLHIFCLKPWDFNKYLKFCKFANYFAEYLSRVQGLSKSVYQML